MLATKKSRRGIHTLFDQLVLQPSLIKDVAFPILDHKEYPRSERQSTM